MRKAFTRLISALFPLIDFVWPKDNALVLFSRPVYGDNSRALFEYISEGDSGLRAVWMADTPDAVAEVRQAYPRGRVVLKGSFAGALAFLRARSVAITKDLAVFYPYSVRSGRKKVVMLWHAISFKRSKLLNNSKSEADKEAIRKESRRYSLMIASSPLDRASKCAVNGISEDKVVVSGLPRSDRLQAPGWTRPTYSDHIERALASRTILYAPTWRDTGEPTRFFPFDDFDPIVLNQRLSEAGAYILYRPHRRDKINTARGEEWAAAGIDRMVLTRERDVADVADILNDVDVLISDYSSIYLDLLAVGTPMIFVPYDLEAYQRDRGLLYDYEDITPGPKVSSQAQMLDAIHDSLNGAPAFKAKRDACRSMFHTHTDGQACRRVTDAIRAMADA